MIIECQQQGGIGREGAVQWESPRNESVSSFSGKVLLDKNGILITVGPPGCMGSHENENERSESNGKSGMKVR